MACLEPRRISRLDSADRRAPLLRTLERTSFWQRLRGARETELFGPRGRLPTRGEPDTSANVALLSLVAVTAVGLALRLAVPRGIWLDEAISIHQANLSFHAMFENLQYRHEVKRRGAARGARGM